MTDIEGVLSKALRDLDETGIEDYLTLEALCDERAAVALGVVRDALNDPATMDDVVRAYDYGAGSPQEVLDAIAARLGRPVTAETVALTVAVVALAVFTVLFVVKVLA